MVGVLAGLGAVVFIVLVWVSFTVCVILPLHINHRRRKQDNAESGKTTVSYELTTKPDVSVCLYNYV